MAVQVLQARYARLVEGGADADARIELAAIFIDLPVAVPYGQIQGAMRLLLGASVLQDDGAAAMRRLRREPGAPARRLRGPEVRDGRPRWLLVGGPGSGKSTLTTMIAQVLRLPWIDRQVGALPEQVRGPWQRTRAGLSELAGRDTWDLGGGALPLRVSLPSLARWMAARGAGTPPSLWDYLAAQMVEDLALPSHTRFPNRRASLTPPL
jgi:hypothetical protein